MTAQITVPFETLRQQWKKMEAPVFIRKTSRPNWVTIVPKRGATQAEVELFLFGKVISR